MGFSVGARRRLLGASRHLMLAGTAFSIVTAGSAFAQTPSAASSTAARSFSIPAQPLRSALRQLMQQGNVQIGFEAEDVNGKTSAPVSGKMDTGGALSRLLSGTGLTYRYLTSGSVVLVRAPRVADGTVELGTLRVEGAAADAQGRSGSGSDGLSDQESRPYRTPGTSVYISQEKIERFRGTSPADILREAPGVYSGQSRASGGLDVNIRGLQGQGRVVVTVDGAQNSTALYRGYQGISNATFIDPDFIGGISVEKGANMAAGGAGAIGGTVSMKTLSVSDVVPEGESFGIRLKLEGSGNSTSPWTSLGKRHLGNPGGRDQPGHIFQFKESELERPSLFNIGSKSASIVLASRSDNLDLLGGFSRRSSGNYHAGKKGDDAPRPIQCDPDIFDCGVDWYTKGLSIYLPGEEVLNTSQDNYSALLKATVRVGDSHSVNLGYSHYNSRFGEQYPTDLSSESGTTSQRNPSLIKVDSYTLRYGWNPESALVDLKWNAWATSLEETTVGASGPVVKESEMRGTDLSNTSRLNTSLGTLSLHYGLSYLHEKTAPTELNGNVRPREGKRWEASAFLNAGLQAAHWLELDGGLRYHRFESENLAPGNTDPVQKDDALDYSAVITFKPVDGAQIYGIYKHASRLPSLFEATGGFATTVDPNLRPETSKTWEFGANVSRDSLFADGDQLGFKLSYYDTRVEDYINRRAAGAGRMHIANIEEARFSGFDLSASYEIGGFRADLGGTYYTNVEYCPTRESCINSSLASDYATNYVPPEYSFNLSLTQKLLAESLALTARLNHTGPRAAGAQATGTGGAALLAQIPWKPYTLVDVAAEYRLTDFLALNLAVENVTDVYYVEPLNLARLPSPGRTLRIGLTGNFSASSLAAISGTQKPARDSWTGLYAGIHASAGRGSYEVHDLRQNGGYPQDYLFEDTAVYAGGVQLGYHHQFPSNIVLGIEGEFSLLKSDKLMVLSTRQRFQSEANWLGTVRGKIGYALGDVLIYGAGGYAVADMDGAFEQASGPWGNFTWSGVSTSARVSGWTVGGGLEYALTNALSVKGEYSSANLSHGRMNAPAFNQTEYSWDTRPRIDQLKLGVNYRF